MPLAPHYRRFLIVDQGLVAFVINFVLNGGIAYVLFRGAQSVPFLGPSSIVGDTVVTSFLLPFATCMIVTGLIDKAIATGNLTPLAPLPAGSLGGFFAARGKAARGALLGVAAVVLIALPTLFALSASGTEALARNAFLWFKAGYAGALALIAQPAIAWLALATKAPR